MRDGEGSVSATRLASPAWSLGVLGVWMANPLRSTQPCKLDPQVISIMGIRMTGKVTQSFAETQDAEVKIEADRTTRLASQIPSTAISGTFTTADGKAVTIQSGVVTHIV